MLLDQVLLNIRFIGGYMDDNKDEITDSQQNEADTPVEGDDSSSQKVEVSTEPTSSSEPESNKSIDELTSEAQASSEDKAEIDHEVEDTLQEATKEEPTTEPQVTQPKQPIEDNTKKKRKVPKWAYPVVAMFAVLLLAGSGFAVYQKVMSSPEVIARDAIVNSLAAETVSFEADIEFQLEGSEDIFSGVKLTGQSDSSGNVNAELGLDLVFSQIDIAMKAIDEIVYLKASGLGLFSSLLAESTGGLVSEDDSGDLIASIEDQWIEIDPSTVPGLEDLTFSETTLSKEDQEKLEDLFFSNVFLTVDEDLGVEDVDGVESYHYKIGIDKEKLKEFVAEAEESNIVQDDSLVDLSSISEDIDNTDFESIELEVWISKADRLFTKISFSGNDNEGSYSVSLMLKDYNQEIDTNVPQDVKTFEEVFSAFGSSFGAEAAVMSESDSATEDETSEDQTADTNTDNDATRRENIDTAYIELLSYYASAEKYPTTANMEDEEGWASEMLDLESSDLFDPSGKGINEAGGYVYVAYPSGCDNSTSSCTSFSISADLEGDGREQSDSDSDAADYIKSS